MTPAEATAQAKQIRVRASDLTLDDLAAAIVEGIAREIEPLRERIAAIEARLAVKSGGR